MADSILVLSISLRFNDELSTTGSSPSLKDLLLSILLNSGGLLMALILIVESIGLEESVPSSTFQEMVRWTVVGLFDVLLYVTD